MKRFRRLLHIVNAISHIPIRIYHALWFTLYGLPWKRIHSTGLPQIKNEGSIVLKGPLFMTNKANKATLGINRKCKLNVYKNASLEINGPLSMSNTTIVATKHIRFGSNVMIGGGHFYC